MNERIELLESPGRGSNKMEGQTFVDELRRDFLITTFVPRLSTMTANSEPPLAGPREAFTSDIHGLHVAMRRSLSQASSIIRQVELPPPEDWLARVGVSTSAFSQSQLDLFSVVLYSTLDRALLLTNELWALDIPKRMCTYERVRRQLTEPATISALAALREALARVEEPRHTFVHRGTSRAIGLFSAVRRLEVISDAFGVPMEGVHPNTAGASEDILKTMLEELESVANPLLALDEACLIQYRLRLDELTEYPEPTLDDLKRCLEVIDYFAGGPEPQWYSGEDPSQA